MSTTPAILVTGIDDEAMTSMTLTLQWDLPDAVVVHHSIDVETQCLRRTVSDVTGVLEHVDVNLEHACVSCAIREDIVPTLQRLAASERWSAIVAQLPVAAEAAQVCRVVSMSRGTATCVQIHGVVAAMAGDHVCSDVLGDSLLAERGLHTSNEDRRGVGEVCASLIEYADVITLGDRADNLCVDLVQALSRPGAHVIADGSTLKASLFLDEAFRNPDAIESWVADVRRDELPDRSGGRTWTLDLRSDRPLHPGRLMDSLERLGGGPHRSRGCFWLPSRPGIACAWDGAGGLVSIGLSQPWRLESPLTRLVVTGMDEGRDAIAATFAHCLLNDTEIADRGLYWEVSEDGLEPWLGDIRHAA